ncbi:MAG: TRAM domain-containing protein [Candidatus Marsarchaeota archaeon]|jgi:predicted RNA-binding protein with TRAM domain|nr:TRAM domain-containing protein [Candidatus Marsarchaeota archaeon]
MNEEDEGMENRGERRGNRGGDHSGRGGMRIKPDYFMPKPVKVGDEVNVKIEAVASKGDGIAKVDGFVIFVKGAKEGDELKIKITEVKARHANGEIVQ